MTKDEFIEAGRKAFKEMVRNIGDHPEKFADEKFKAMLYRDSICKNGEQEKWFMIGFNHGSEQNKNDFEEWNSKYWSIVESLQNIGLGEEEIEAMLFIWNEKYMMNKLTEEHAVVYKA